MKKFKLSLLTLGFVFVFCSVSWAAIVKGDGRKEVATAGTAEALSATSLDVTIVTICGETNNTGTVVIGASTVVAAVATRRGIPLDASDCYTYQLESKRTMNLNQIYVDTTVSTDGVTYDWVRQV